MPDTICKLLQQTQIGAGHHLQVIDRCRIPFASYCSKYGHSKQPHQPLTYSHSDIEVASMGRAPRIHIPGGFYHVILRGNNRQALFYSNSDFRTWEKNLTKGLKRYGHSIHAWCWMTNHIHIALQAGSQPISSFMQYVASRYAAQHNHRLNRTGHLFERRYKAININADSYLLMLVRYIHMNPVQAGIVKRPEEYKWSSHRSYSDLENCEFLNTKTVLSAFDSNSALARIKYCKFMHTFTEPAAANELTPSQESRNPAAEQNTYIPTALGFRLASERQALFDKIVRDICIHTNLTEEQLKLPGRNKTHARIRTLIAKQAIEMGVATVTDIAKRFHKSTTTICQSLKG